MLLTMLNESQKVIDILLLEKQDIKTRIRLIKNKKTISEAIGLIMDTHNSLLQTYGKINDTGEAIFDNDIDKSKCIEEISNMYRNIKKEQMGNITIFNIYELAGLEKLDNDQLSYIEFMLDLD